MSPQNKKLQSVIEGLLPSRRPLRVLEAGCGSSSHLPLDSTWELTGIDLSERQLKNNHHLHEKILGNLETHKWDAARFDMIVCWDVIEHLPNPRKALKNLMDGLAPGGILVLAFPHLYSVKGLVTKLTPYWIHFAFYRYIIGDKRSRDETGQFPTFLRMDILPQRIVDFAKENGVECKYRENYEGPVQTFLRQRNPLANAIFWLTGLFKLNDSDCMLVLQRPAR